MKDLVVIVPTRSRPYNVLPVIEAWIRTEAFEVAALALGIDADDPERAAYLAVIDRARATYPGAEIKIDAYSRHYQLVPKLNMAARKYVTLTNPPTAMGFAGDDHRPRTPRWAHRYLETLRELGTGVVYPDDGYQGDRIPTSWAMTSDIVRALDAMVPAGVEHLYCDNAIKDLAESAGCLRYLPNVLVEHLHPAAGKADEDAQYARVNGREQYRHDRRAYRQWRTHDLARQAGVVRTLRKGVLP